MTNIQLEKSFNNLSSEYRIFLRNHHDEEKPALLNPSENLNIAMNNFRRDINNCTENDKKRLLKYYEPEIITICNGFKSLKKWDYISFCDSVFHNKLKIKRDNDYLSHLFMKFIEGITYFSKEKTNNRPVYHRLYSCGPRNAGEYTLSCKNMNTNQKRLQRKNTEKCYIERLIYDILYTNETYHSQTQDTAHLNRLEIIKEDYKSCFKGYEINVEIKFYNSKPQTLIINKKNGVITHETYIKTYIEKIGERELYYPVVDCYKTVSNNLYYKNQTFNKQKKWRKVDNPDKSLSNNISEKSIILSTPQTI